ncbi:piwi domain protein [Trichuris suis]|nr:piwi domain protein [Trichuris suis]
MTSTSGEVSSSLSQLTISDPVARPDYGREGKRIHLMSNFVELKKVATGLIEVVQYYVNVDSDKVKLTRDDKRRVFWTFVKQTPKIFTNPFSVAYDGEALLFSREPLRIKDNERFEAQLKVQVLHSRTPTEVKVGIKKSGMVKIVFKDPKSGGGLPTDSEQSPIQVVDVILAQGRACTLISRSERFCVVGNSAYEVPERCGVNLKFGVELWRGLFTSARVGEGYRPMVNIDVSHAAFYRPQSVLNYICDVLNADRSPREYSVDQIQSNTRLTEGEMKIVGRAIKGLRVTITHRNRDAQYRIIGIGADASRQMFTLRDGREVSVADYFKETYFQLRYPRMPALQAGSKNRSIYLPVEVSVVEPSNGTWQMRDLQFFQGGNCANFSAVAFGRSSSLGQVGEFCTNVAKVCNDLGMNVGRKADILLPVRDTAAFERVLQRLVTEYKENNKVCRLVFVALSDTKEYPEVKRVADVKFGIMTQCFMQRVLHDVVVKHSVMTATNLALKINMKMGGVNTRLLADPFVKSNLTDKDTLVLGVDVTHPHVADRDSPSIAAVVGNVDVNCAEYAASIRVQPNRWESILYLEDEFRGRIRAFVYRSNRRPSRIIVFRDGVSEGEFRQVLREELRALRAACRSLDKAYRPGITYVVVQKRHHARFMCKDESMAVGKGRNIPAGTVIDRRVTSADGYDFYLCSHTGIQGTSKPAKYNVLYDDNNLNSDTMQAIAYYLCHVYGRCMRSVSIPAPVYFAHLACYRSRHHSYLLTGSSDDSFGSRKKEPSSVEFTRAVAVHDNIRSSMYFV